MVRGQKRGQGGWQFSAKGLLAALAVIAMIGSVVYWWGVQSQHTTNTVVAAAFTAILVLARPSLTSFLIPWSPGGMLLQKINARTWGYAVIIGAAGYLLYYSFEIQYSWWQAQAGVRDTGLVLQQVLIGIIGFIMIPALLWTPVTSEELVEQVRQAHLVRRYELGDSVCLSAKVQLETCVSNRVHRRTGFVPSHTNKCTAYRGLAQPNGLKPLKQALPPSRKRAGLPRLKASMS